MAKPAAAVTLAELLHRLVERFNAAELVYGHGTDNAWDEAVALTLGVLGWEDREENLAREISSAALAVVDQLARRRIDDREPVPLLLGHSRFADLEFSVAPGVMLPRSPIAELVHKRFAPWLQGVPNRVLDLCAGGGCLGIACAYAFSRAQVVLAEIDPRALALAERNIERHALSSRVTTVAADLFTGLTGRFELIVCNPPYVPSGETAVRPAEFQHEPVAAYEGGADGMDLVARIVAGAADYLTADGLLVLEVGQFTAEFEARHPRLPYTVCDLEYGGEGVLLLEADALAEHTAHRAG